MCWVLGTSSCSFVETDETIQRICNEVINLSAVSGLTDEILLKACSNLGCVHYVSMFPEGIHDVLRYVYKSLSNFLVLSQGDIDSVNHPRIRDKIGYSLKACIKYQASLPHFREYTKKLLEFFFSPQNLCFTSSVTFGLADTVWYLAGDSSTKFDYYTKRLTVSSIYLSSLMYLRGDTSDDLSDTLSFIDRRIENVLAFHKFKGKLSGLLGRFCMLRI